MPKWTPRNKTTAIIRNPIPANAHALREQPNTPPHINDNVCIYIYIYIYTQLSLSLSLFCMYIYIYRERDIIYIYIYIHTYMYYVPPRRHVQVNGPGRDAAGREAEDAVAEQVVVVLFVYYRLLCVSVLYVLFCCVSMVRVILCDCCV